MVFEKYDVSRKFTADHFCSECGREHDARPAKDGIAVGVGSVTFRGAEVRMPQRQVQMCEQLLRAYPSSVSKDRMFAAVWGYESEVDPKILDVLICRIRAALPPGLAIKTLRGSGWQFVAETTPAESLNLSNV